MKNTVLNFESREVVLNGEHFDVPDYFSKNVSLENIVKSNPDAFMPYRVNTNDKMEKISFDLYENPNYWDILVLINNLAPLTDMIYDDSVIAKSKEEFFKRFDEFFGWVKAVNPARYDALMQGANDNIDDSLEEHRYIMVVKSSYIPTILRQLKRDGLT